MAKVKRRFPAFDPTNVCMDAVTAAADWQRNLKVQYVFDVDGAELARCAVIPSG